MLPHNGDNTKKQLWKHFKKLGDNPQKIRGKGKNMEDKVSCQPSLFMPFTSAIGMNYKFSGAYAILKTKIK